MLEHRISQADMLIIESTWIVRKRLENAGFDLNKTIEVQMDFETGDYIYKQKQTNQNSN